jgi:hypothetical protein
MFKAHRNKIVGGAAGVLAVGFTTAALAQSGVFSPREESEAILDDAAEQLGVEPAELSDALKRALKNRVDEAVEAGRLTEEEGQDLKERIDANEVPLVGLGPGLHGPGHHVHFGGLDAAATYLGVTEDELRTSLEEGTTLAELAREKGKTVEGLVDAMVADAREKLDEAVEDGRLTEEQHASILSTLEERITEMVNRELPPGPPLGRGFGPPSGMGWDSRSGGDSGSETSASATAETA